MTRILGLSAFYHDSAAALVVDGEIVAAAQEERFTRRKHDADFPAQAVASCLAQAGIEPDEIDYVAYYEKPLLKFDRLLETYLAIAPAGFASFRSALPVWLKEKLHLRRVLQRHLPEVDPRKFVFLEHHESHAASAFFPSPFDAAAIVTVDGVGEWATTTIGVGEGNRLRLQREQRFPHSLGLLYSAFTYYCGFRVNSGEYKLMGLAPFGTPRFADVIREHLVAAKPDGSFALNLASFDFCGGLRMTNRRFDALFGGPPRAPEAPIEERHLDLAASIQLVTEELMLGIVREAHRLTGQTNLVLAGGVALNCVANGRLLREGPFERIWVQPASGDAGGALGAALFAWHQLLEKPRPARSGDTQRGSLLGPRANGAEIERALAAHEVKGMKYAAESELLQQVAQHLAAGEVVGWFHGPMEFGPRALGARSILGDARSPRMQTTMNQKIKFRESFRPFAPCVLRERAAEYFEVPPGFDHPYMLFTVPLAPGQRRGTAEATPKTDLLGRVQVYRSTLSAVTHVDYSARVQTVDEARHGRFYRLLREFERQTGCPVLVNTSFNVRGEPIVGSADDAVRCFLATDMDVLVLEDTVLRKRDLGHSAAALAARRAQHLAALPLD